MNITGEFWHDYRNGQLGGVHGSTNSFSGAFKFGSKKVTSSPTWDNYGDAKSIAFDASKSWSGATSNTGANNTHNNIQPYIACYIFRRVS